MVAVFVTVLISGISGQRAWGNVLDHTDYNGDGISDLGHYYAMGGEWAVKMSDNSSPFYRQWGWDKALAVPGDYDGDGKADVAVHHPETGEWFIVLSSGGSRKAVWGWAETVPVPADYDGDGKTDIAVYHPKGGNWFISESSTGRLRRQNWGWNETRPVPADFDGDGRADLAVYHPAEGMWYIAYSAGGSLVRNWGWDRAVPLPADYDGDGKADLAVFDPVINDWHILRTTTKTLQRFTFNIPDTIPVVGRYNADTSVDIAFYQPKSGFWGIYLTLLNAPRLETWGGTMHRPAASWLWRSYDQIRFETPGQPGIPPDSGGVPGTPQVPANFANVTWLHSDVSKWRQTANLSVNISGSKINLPYDRANVWPAVNHIGTVVNANPWIFVPKSDGSGWYAATWEWLRPGQTSKNLSSVAGDHIKKSPLQDFRPVSGTWYGFMVTGLARDSKRNVEERSNVFMLKWP
jgi:hypothetical protein